MLKVLRTSFEGLDGVELRTSHLRLVGVSAFGPRLAFFGKPGAANLLLWTPGRYTRGDWDLRGGHRVWVTRPGADENEDTYATDNAACDVTIEPDGFTLTGAENTANRTRRGMRVTCVSEDTLRVDNFVINTGAMLYSGGLWALTCTVPTAATSYGVPLGDGTEWDVCTVVLFRRWAGHGVGGLDDPQFQVKNDMLMLHSRGIENKRMVQSHHGILAMRDPDRGLTFAKRAPWLAGGTYPVNTNVALYVGPENFMVEMETMGPERTLRPGEALHHVETWVLKDGAVPLDHTASVTALFA